MLCRIISWLPREWLHRVTICNNLYIDPIFYDELACDPMHILVDLLCVNNF